MAPEIFSETASGIWDGRPSLGGIWVAHPDVDSPERVLITNDENGEAIVGALFKRERSYPGPKFQVSAEAAIALEMLPGAPARLSVTAFRGKDDERPTVRLDARRPEAAAALRERGTTTDPATDPAATEMADAAGEVPIPVSVDRASMAALTDGVALADASPAEGTGDMTAGQADAIEGLVVMSENAVHVAGPAAVAPSPAGLPSPEVAVPPLPSFAEATLSAAFATDDGALLTCDAQQEIGRVPVVAIAVVTPGEPLRLAAICPVPETEMIVIGSNAGSTPVPEEEAGEDALTLEAAAPADLPSPQTPGPAEADLAAPESLDGAFVSGRTEVGEADPQATMPLAEPPEAPRFVAPPPPLSMDGGSP